ncbi:MAG: hypothetical protein IK080_04340, partial [Clostridia bacterium]|nr:hypothetical protein [Clostridia bacterium]
MRYVKYPCAEEIRNCTQIASLFDGSQFCGSRNCSEKGKAAHGILDVCQCGFDAFMGDLCPAKPILVYES